MLKLKRVLAGLSLLAVFSLTWVALAANSPVGIVKGVNGQWANAQCFSGSTPVTCTEHWIFGSGSQDPQAGFGSDGDLFWRTDLGAFRTRSAGAWAALPLSTWTDIFKTSDQAKTNNVTPADDTTLTFPVLANKVYDVEGVMHFTAASAGGIRVHLSCPASPTLVMFEACVGTGSSGEACTPATADCSTDQNYNSGTYTVAFLRIVSRLNNGANAGTAAFSWAQSNVNGTPTTVQTGSYLRYKQVN